MALRHPIESDELDAPEGVIYLTGQAALDFFEREIQRLMDISGAEFIERYESGEYETLEDIPENWNVLRASFLIPFAKNNS